MALALLTQISMAAEFFDGSGDKASATCASSRISHTWQRLAGGLLDLSAAV